MAEILAADDSSVLRMFMSAVLGGGGHRVRVAEDGLEVLTALGETAPDVLILDVEMPHLDGFAVLKQMRKSHVGRSTRVMMLTGKNRDADWLKAYRLGAHYYLPKPFEPADLLVAIQELLDMTLDEAEERRQTELDRAELLARLESAFI